MSATTALRCFVAALALLVGVKGVQLARNFPGGGDAGLLVGGGVAHAANPPARTPPPAAATLPQAAAAPATPAPRTEEPAPASEQVAAALRSRREALEQREAALATREVVLAAAERRLAARIEELSGLQTRLERAQGEAREREDAHWRGLARFYELMRPREAAAVLNELELPVLAQLVDRMGERKAAPILGAMAPDRVRQVTLELTRVRAARPSPQ
jgi:flagellar motility protein MotE (MotC chaperone)